MVKASKEWIGRLLNRLKCRHIARTLTTCVHFAVFHQSDAVDPTTDFHNCSHNGMIIPMIKFFTVFSLGCG